MGATPLTGGPLPRWLPRDDAVTASPKVRATCPIATGRRGPPTDITLTITGGTAATIEQCGVDAPESRGTFGDRRKRRRTRRSGRTPRAARADGEEWKAPEFSGSPFSHRLPRPKPVQTSVLCGRRANGPRFGRATAKTAGSVPSTEDQAGNGSFNSVSPPRFEPRRHFSMSFGGTFLKARPVATSGRAPGDHAGERGICADHCGGVASRVDPVGFERPVFIPRPAPESG